MDEQIGYDIFLMYYKTMRFVAWNGQCKNSNDNGIIDWSLLKMCGLLTHEISLKFLSIWRLLFYRSNFVIHSLYSQIHVTNANEWAECSVTFVSHIRIILKSMLLTLINLSVLNVFAKFYEPCRPLDALVQNAANVTTFSSSLFSGTKNSRRLGIFLVFQRSSVSRFCSTKSVNVMFFRHSFQNSSYRFVVCSVTNYFLVKAVARS